MLEVLAPAKLNLGLEVIRRRPDGYHDIATVMQTVSIFDRLSFAPDSEFTCHSDDFQIEAEDNLIVRAARSLISQSTASMTARVSLRKRIPVAAGLGGASSDAAATLMALAHLGGQLTLPKELEAIAFSIGSDVPFLLRGGTALAEGRGERLTALSPPGHAWFVVASPAMQIPAKTATLYSSLVADDFSDGNRIRRLASLIDGLSTPDLDQSFARVVNASLLGNAFLRPLLAMKPELYRLHDAFAAAGAAFVALSGAGPTHYTVLASVESGHQIAQRLRRLVDRQTKVMVCRPVDRAPIIRTEADFASH